MTNNTKFSLFYLLIGLILFINGELRLVYFSSPLDSLSLFVGCLFCCASTGIFSTVKHNMTVSSFWQGAEVERESLFLTRLFVELAFIARNQGILALEENPHDKNYRNPFFHLGKDMVMDGYDPDYIREVMENINKTLAYHLTAKITCLKHLGLCLLSSGLIALLAGILSLYLRIYSGEAIAVIVPVVLMVFVSAFCLMGLFCLFFLPLYLKDQQHRQLSLQKQIMAGIFSLQAGDSYNAIMRLQLSFLSREDMLSLLEQPMLEMDDEENLSSSQKKEYEVIQQTLRKEITNWHMV